MVLPGEIFGQTGMIAVQIGTKYDWSNGFRASQVLFNQSYFTSLKLSGRLEIPERTYLAAEKGRISISDFAGVLFMPGNEQTDRTTEYYNA